VASWIGGTKRVAQRGAGTVCRSGNRMLVFEPGVKATIKIGIGRWSGDAWQRGEQEWHAFANLACCAACMLLCHSLSNADWKKRPRNGAFASSRPRKSTLAREYCLNNFGKAAFVHQRGGF
jgi:hypothetical protein